MKKAKLIQKLISTDSDMDSLIQICREVQFPEKGNYVCLVVRQYYGGMAPKEILEYLDHVLQKQGNPFLLDYLGEIGYVCVLQCKNNDKDFLRQIAGSIIKKEKLIVGIGLWVGGLGTVGQSYRSAVRVLEMHFFEPEKRILDLEEEMLLPQRLDAGIYNRFLSLMKEDPVRLKEYTEELMDEIEDSRQYRQENIKSLFISLLQAVLQEKKGLSFYLNENFRPEDIENRVSRMDTFTEVRSYVTAFLEALIEENDAKTGYSWVVRKILEYIDEHLDNSELSIQEIADQVSLSATYISILFKKEVQVNLKQYISNVRMDKAKKMLKNDCYKITEIAEKCGYANANYFSRAFKKSENMTPIEYREKQEL